MDLLKYIFYLKIFGGRINSTHEDLYENREICRNTGIYVKLYILWLGILLSCQQASENQENSQSQDTTTTDSLYLPVDFTPEEVFTSGIEGPAVYTNGMLYVVNYDYKGTIGQVDTEGNAGLFITLPEGSVGNAIRFDQSGYMYIADYPMHNVLRVDMSTQSLEVYVHETDMNQPNDLAITSTGMLFASDPSWADSTGQLWRIDTNRQVTLLESDMGTTNGIEVNPTEDRLYVNESVQRKVWVYDLSSSGELSNKRLFTQFEDFGLDGMRCDAQGNLYITRHGKGTIAIYSPNGEMVREIQLTGTKPSNIAFGGPDGKTCYITLQDRGSIETFRAEYPGRAWNMLNP